MTISEFSWLDSIVYVYPLLSYCMVLYYWTMYGPVAHVWAALGHGRLASCVPRRLPLPSWYFILCKTNHCMFLIFNKFHV